MKRLRNEDECDGSDMFKKLMPSIRKVGTHIYFYSDIDTQSALDLITLLNETSFEIQQKSLELDLENLPPIHLHINSCGGNLLDAFAIVDHIKLSKVPIISIVEGSSCSAATLVSIVCHTRYITKNAYMLIHELRSGNWGKFSDLTEEMKNLNDLMSRLNTIYVQHTKLTKDNLKKYLEKDRYWSANLCLKNGLVDKII